MSARYDFYKNPPSEKHPNKVRLHPRIVPYRTATPAYLAKLIQERCTVNTADVGAVLESLHQVLVQELNMGNRVHIDGLGYFSMTLESKDPVRTPRDIRAESIHFRSVAFRPEVRLVKRLKDVSLERNAHKNHSENLSDAAIEEQLSLHFNQHETLRRSEFQVLTGLLRSSAIRKLNELLSAGKIRNIGHPRYPIYVRV